MFPFTSSRWNLLRIVRPIEPLQNCRLQATLRNDLHKYHIKLTQSGFEEMYVNTGMSC